MKIVAERAGHLAEAHEVGTLRCPRCQSDLRATRADFTREKRPGGKSIATCPVKLCGHVTSESDWIWGVDPEIEKRAKDAFDRSQAHLHNLQITAWHEASETTKAEWRARVA